MLVSRRATNAEVFQSSMRICCTNLTRPKFCKSQPSTNHLLLLMEINPVNSPVEVGSCCYDLQGFSTIPGGWPWGSFHQQYHQKNLKPQGCRAIFIRTIHTQLLAFGEFSELKLATLRVHCLPTMGPQNLHL